MQKAIGILVAIILTTLVVSQTGREALALKRTPGAGAGATCGCLCYGKTGWCKASTGKDGLSCSCSKDPVYPCSGTCTKEKTTKQ